MFTNEDVQRIDTPNRLAEFWAEQNDASLGWIGGQLVSVNNGEETRYFLVETVDLKTNNVNQDPMVQLGVMMGAVPAGVGRISEANSDGTLQAVYNTSHGHDVVKGVGSIERPVTVDEAVDTLVDWLNGLPLGEDWITPDQH